MTRFFMKYSSGDLSVGIGDKGLGVRDSCVSTLLLEIGLRICLPLHATFISKEEPT